MTRVNFAPILVGLGVVVLASSGVLLYVSLQGQGDELVADLDHKHLHHTLTVEWESHSTQDAVVTRLVDSSYEIRTSPGCGLKEVDATALCASGFDPAEWEHVATPPCDPDAESCYLGLGSFEIHSDPGFSTNPDKAPPRTLYYASHYNVGNGPLAWLKPDGAARVSFDWGYWPVYAEWQATVYAYEVQWSKSVWGDVIEWGRVGEPVTHRINVVPPE